MSILFTKPLHKNVENISAQNLLKEAIYSGYIEKRSGGTLRDPYQKRFFVIARNMLWWFKNEQSAYPQAQIVLQEYMVVVPDTNSKTTEFEEEEFLIQPRRDSSLDRTFFFKCDTVKQKKDWVDILKGETDVPIKAPTQIRLQAQELNIDPIDMKITTRGNGFMQGLFRNKDQTYLQLLAKLDDTTNEDLSQFYHDIEPAANLSHKHVIPIYGFFKEKGSLYLATKFPRAGKLSDIIFQQTIKLTLSNRVDLCVWISLGMIYLHTKNMIHGNLNPSSVMVDDQKEGKVYVSEYGLTFFRKKWVQNSFAAPEVKSWKENSKQSDVYAFGVLMWEIFTREQTLLNHSEMSMPQYVKKKVTELPELANLVAKCCATNPDERPTFFQIYQTLLNIARDVTPPPPRNAVYSTIRKSDADTKKDAVSEDPDAAINSDQALMRFGARPEKHWKDFVWIIANCLDKDPRIVVEQMEPLRVFLAPENIIKKDSWKNFVRYFPLRYTIDCIDPNTFTLSEMGQIVSQPWFFGELSHAKSKELLKEKPVGTFLIRFSKEPGSFQLSLSSGESTAHVRIIFQNNHYMIETREYDTLESLINIHKENALNTLYGEIKLTESVEKAGVIAVIPFDFNMVYAMVEAKQNKEAAVANAGSPPTPVNSAESSSEKSSDNAAVAAKSPVSSPPASPPPEQPPQQPQEQPQQQQQQPQQQPQPQQQKPPTSNERRQTQVFLAPKRSSPKSTLIINDTARGVYDVKDQDVQKEEEKSSKISTQLQFGYRTSSSRNLRDGVLLSKQRSESPPPPAIEIILDLETSQGKRSTQ